MNEDAKSAFVAAFLGRTKFAREARDISQQEMAELLGIDQGTYKQYEARSPLPHWIVPRFCKITGIDPTWLYTDNGRAPLVIPKARKQKRQQAA